MNNIEIFRLIVFNVMHEIVTVFPAYAHFGFEKILPEMVCPDEETRMDYCLNTMAWLEANGYVNVIGKGSLVNGWENVVPTEKMLALLSVELPDMKNKTIFESVIEIGKEGIKSAMQDAVKNLFLNAVKYGGPLLASSLLK